MKGGHEEAVVSTGCRALSMVRYLLRIHSGSAGITVPDDVDSFMKSEVTGIAFYGGPVMDVVLEVIRRRPN
jgi:hypothetical protein